MLLRSLLKQIRVLDILGGDPDTEILSVAYDSRKVRRGCLFIGKGFEFDPAYAADAASNGASAVVLEPGIDIELPKEVVLIRVPDTREALALLSAAFYDFPSRKLMLAGVTGTKGKTTTTSMIYSAAEHAGLKAGLIGTIENRIGSEVQYAERTTPESLDLQSLLDEMVRQQVGLAAMEVSSQGLQYHRVTGCDFNVGVFTNITRDHIGPGEHKDFDEYVKAKAKLFRMCKKGAVNADSEHAGTIIGQADCEQLVTFGIQNPAGIRAMNIEKLSGGTAFDVVTPWWEGRIRMDLIGSFNIYNALAAISACGLMGLPMEAVQKGLGHVRVKGRTEPVPTGRDFSILIDYAHNAISLESLLLTIREYARGRVICLFGCGGDRDPARRFEMGEVSGRLADFSIITSDNPRTEDPERILDHIETGIRRTQGGYIRITDRTSAIRYAILNARKDDIIILAGKGHESYQIFKDKTIHYDEREIAAKILAEPGMADERRIPAEPDMERQ